MDVDAVAADVVLNTATATVTEAAAEVTAAASVTAVAAAVWDKVESAIVVTVVAAVSAAINTLKGLTDNVSIVKLHETANSFPDPFDFEDIDASKIREIVIKQVNPQFPKSHFFKSR